MTIINEPKPMAEIRKIREELSRELKNLTSDERAALIKKGAAEFEEKFRLNLPRLTKESGAGK
ncbi:MAG: hypothetical protein AB1742_06935 [bacterium]